MPASPISVRDILLEQTERTRQSSKADIERLIEESELKIASLESQISTLVELRDRESACAAAFRHLISPISTLPAELLVEIFVLAVHYNTHITDAFRISQVCSYWRQVAHATPRLWTGRIWVDDFFEWADDLERAEAEQVYVDGLKDWLARSVPLSVSLLFSSELPIISSLVSEEIMGIAARWRSLILIGAPTASAVWRLSECRLDGLEELSLPTLQEDTDIHSSTIISFSAVPRLRKLGISIFSNAPQILMPWSQLVELKLNCDLPDVALDILAQCTNLVKATTGTPGWSVHPEASRDIVALSRLHTLSLDFHEEGYFTPFLHCISAPALEKLHLDFDDDMEWVEAHLTAFQLRAPNITQLELNYSGLTSDDLTAVIRLAPSLTHLHLSFCNHCIDDALIDALRYREGVNPLVPRIHTLVLENWVQNFTEDNLASMIASRWWTDAEVASYSPPPTVSRWTRVKLSLNAFSAHFKDTIEVLRSKGLPLELSDD
jgi:hypothetical protein